VFLAIFLPWAYPGGVTVIGWYWMLNPPLTTSYSIAAGNMKLIVDAHAGSGAYAFLSVVLFNIWRGGSFTAVFLLAGLNAIPNELFEYARLETRSAWQRFWLVTLPLLRPYVALAVFLSFTMAFADLANVWMLTGGRIIFPLVGTYAYWLAIKVGGGEGGLSLAGAAGPWHCGRCSGGLIPREARHDAALSAACATAASSCRAIASVFPISFHHGPRQDPRRTYSAAPIMGPTFENYGVVRRRSWRAAT
jgi:hypothetical protein